jgi:hypothetical protein
MGRFVLWCDVDGVVSNTVAGIQIEVARNTGVVFRPQDVGQQAVTQALADSGLFESGSDMEVYVKEAIYKAFASPLFYSALGHYPEAWAAVVSLLMAKSQKELWADLVDVRFLTARPFETTRMRVASQKWISDRFGWDALLYFERAHGAKDKGEFLSQWGREAAESETWLILEDSLEQVYGIQREIMAGCLPCKNIFVFLVDRPWNQMGCKGNDEILHSLANGQWIRISESGLEMALSKQVLQHAQDNTEEEG